MNPIKLFLYSFFSVIAVALLSEKVFAADTNTISSTVSSNTVTTVDKTPPSAHAPNVVINNSDVCTTASTGAVQSTVIGFSAGTTHRDLMCERLKLARQLYGSGMKVAAVSMICQDSRVFIAMWHAGTYCPYLSSIGKAAKTAWLENYNSLPEGVTLKDLMPEAEYKEWETALIEANKKKRNWTTTECGYDNPSFPHC